MKKIIVFYHGDCPDGFGGAWAAWKKFGDKAEYRALFHNGKMPANTAGREVYFIDFCPKHEWIAKLLKRAKKLVVIDHHASAERDVRSIPDHVFDNGHSGSVLAWRYFHGTEAPKMLQHIEDVDIWRFNLANTKPIHSMLDMLGFDFRAWSRFSADLENAAKRKKIIEKGKAIVAYEDKMIERIAEFYGYPVKFAGHNIYVANSPVFDSQVANYLLKKYPPISIVWRMKKGAKTFSIRSNGTVDVSKIAKKYGGGGHHNSAGFALPGDAPFPWKTIKDK